MVASKFWLSWKRFLGQTEGRSIPFEKLHQPDLSPASFIPISTATSFPFKTSPLLQHLNLIIVTAYYRFLLCHDQREQFSDSLLVQRRCTKVGAFLCNFHHPASQAPAGRILGQSGVRLFDTLKGETPPHVLLRLEC